MKKLVFATYVKFSLLYMYNQLICHLSFLGNYFIVIVCIECFTHINIVGCNNKVILIYSVNVNICIAHYLVGSCIFHQYAYLSLFVIFIWAIHNVELVLCCQNDLLAQYIQNKNK